MAVSVALAQGTGKDSAPQRPYPVDRSPEHDDPLGWPYFDLGLDFYCSAVEKQVYVTMAQDALNTVNARAEEARQSYLQLRQARLRAQQAGDAATAGKLAQEIRQFEARDLPQMTITDPRSAEEQLERVKNGPVIDCGGQTALDDRRPGEPVIEGPGVPDRFCSEAEKQALLSRYEEAANAAAAAVRAWRTYRQHMTRRLYVYRWAITGMTDADRQAMRDLLAREAEAARQKETEYEQKLRDIIRAKLKAEKIPVVDCAPSAGQPPSPPSVGSEGNAGQTISYPVPPRPDLPETPAPPWGKLCTEEARNALLRAYDAQIVQANANVEAANAHLLALNGLSGTATTNRAPFDEIKAINEETRAYQEVVNRVYRIAAELTSDRVVIAGRALDPCPTEQQQEQRQFREGADGEQQQQQEVIPSSSETTQVGQGPLQSPGAFVTAYDKLWEPITVGSNGKVGSGARATEKAVGVLGGLAGGLLGGGGGGRGGGSSSGPPVARCKIKDNEKTVFSDPETGISLKVGAKRSGDSVVVFADVDKSPDKGTFQGGWLGDPDGGASAPDAANICDLWGEWSLSVSWTKSTYVNGSLVSRTSGGFQKSGAFSLPGMISSDSAPQGLWRQFGFSNASHGARGVALTYKLPPAALADGPVTIFLHVTRPSLKTVTTQPFALQLSEGPEGFSIAQAQRPVSQQATRARQATQAQQATQVQQGKAITPLPDVEKVVPAPQGSTGPVPLPYPQPVAPAAATAAGAVPLQ